jgi:hypothetical protein
MRLWGALLSLLVPFRPRPPPDWVLGFAKFGLTLEQCFSSVLATGGTGSGKSSALMHLARGLLNRGCSFIVTCVKVDECERWVRLARETGREEDLIRIAPDQPWRLDFLRYELTRPGGSVQSAGRLMRKLAELSNRDLPEMRGGEAFFERGSEQLELVLSRDIRFGRESRHQVWPSSRELGMSRPGPSP